MIYELRKYRLRPGSLKHAAGCLPFTGGKVDIEWERRQDSIVYTLTPSKPIQVRDGTELREIEKRTELILDIP